MTSPVVPCACGNAHLGYCPGTLTICLQQGRVFNANIQLIDSQTKLPQDWPSGMITRLRFTWGTGTEFVVGGSVDGSRLRFVMCPEDTAMIPLGAWVTLELNYSGGEFDWQIWRQGRLSRCR